jgi:glycosyltransferase involved in cell wall biosynthesis
MKIGFDVSQTGAQKAGCGFFAHALAMSLARENPTLSFDFYPAFGDLYFDSQMPSKNPYVSPRASYGPRFDSLDASAVFWNDAQLEERLDRPDLIHANNFWCPISLQETRLIYTFYDMSFLVDPSWSTEANRIGCFNGIFRASVNADWIVAISEASKRHFLEVFPFFPKERIRVIYPCSRFSDASLAGSRPPVLDTLPAGGFWLSVGTIEPRKNHLGLARAYAQYRRASDRPLPLVLAGGKGWLMEDFQRELRELEVHEHVILTGYVSDDELIWLYRNCFANLYPSFFEGFGLPVLEALQFGAPTFASRTTSIPEILGDAGLLLSPTDYEGWASAMQLLEREPDRRLTMRSLGEARVAQFQWQESSRQLISLYEEALSSPKRFPAR